MEAAPSQAGASVGSGSMSPFSPRRGGERALPRPVHPDTGVSPAPEPPAPSAPSRPHRRGGPCGHAPHQNQHHRGRLRPEEVPEGRLQEVGGLRQVGRQVRHDGRGGLRRHGRRCGHQGNHGVRFLREGHEGGHDPPAILAVIAVATGEQVVRKVRAS